MYLLFIYLAHLCVIFLDGYELMSSFGNVEQRCSADSLKSSAMFGSHATDCHCCYYFGIARLVVTLVVLVL